MKKHNNKKYSPLGDFAPRIGSSSTFENFVTGALILLGLIALGAIIGVVAGYDFCPVYYDIQCLPQ